MGRGAQKEINIGVLDWNDIGEGRRRGRELKGRRMTENGRGRRVGNRGKVVEEEQQGMNR